MHKDVLSTIDVEQIISIAVNAGKEILEIYAQDDFSQRIKIDKSPLTEADLAAHNVITQALKKQTPLIPILSEESSVVPWEERKKWQTYWLIDPLDGTKEFIKRNGEFTVNIALIHDHEPVIGVVHAPVLNTTWVGGKGRPATKIKDNKHQKIFARQRKDNEPWKVAGSRTHAGDSLKNFLEDLGEYELINIGSSIKICLVAEGKVDIYPRLGPTSEWDTAAAHAVVNAAGGEVVNAENGQTLFYNTKDSLLNSNFLVRLATSEHFE